MPAQPTVELLEFTGGAGANLAGKLHRPAPAVEVVGAALPGALLHLLEGPVHHDPYRPGSCRGRLSDPCVRLHGPGRERRCTRRHDRHDERGRHRAGRGGAHPAGRRAVRACRSQPWWGGGDPGGLAPAHRDRRGGGGVAGVGSPCGESLRRRLAAADPGAWPRGCRDRASAGVRRAGLPRRLSVATTSLPQPRGLGRPAARRASRRRRSWSGARADRVTGRRPARGRCAPSLAQTTSSATAATRTNLYATFLDWLSEQRSQR